MAYMKDSKGRRLDSFHVEAVRPQTIVFLGDSLTEQGGMQPGVAAQIKPNSPWTWAVAALGQRFKVLKNAGIGGETTAQILARFDADVTTLNPGWVHILAGTNDMGSGTSGAKANIIAMLDKADKAGIKAIIGTIPPRISSSYSGTMKADTLELNRWIMALARTRPNVILADYFSALADTSGNFRATIAGWNPTSDGVHLSATGGFATGIVLANALKEITTPAYPFAPVAGAGLNLLNYADFSQGASNAAPTGWTVGGSGAAAAVWSTPARADLPGTPWRQVVIANGGGSISLSNNANIGTNGLAVGDTVNAYLEYDVSELDPAAASGSQAFHLAIKFWNGSSYTSTLSSLESFNSPNLARSGALFVPDVTVPTDTTVVTTEITIVGGGTYKLGRCGLYESSVFA